MSERLRIGFLGAGFISRIHLECLAQTSVPNEVTAVHDVDPARAAAFADRTGARVLDADALLDTVDVVYVTTWTSEHPRMVEMAAARGLAVFCEKPLAVDAAGVAMMIEVVEAAAVPNHVGLILRLLPQFVHTRQLLGDPRAGRLMAVSFRDDQYIPNQGMYASEWRTDPARAGRGALLEHSIHDVDILRWLCGPVDAVSAAARETHGYDRIDDVVVARLEFDGGGMASLTSVWHDILERPSLRHIEIFCERLYVRIEGGAATTLHWQFTGGPAESLDPAALAAACAGSPDALTSETAELFGGLVFNPATAFLAAVRDGAPSPLPFAEALPAHRIVDAIYASAAAGGSPVEPAEGVAPA